MLKYYNEAMAIAEMLQDTSAEHQLSGYLQTDQWRAVCAEIEYLPDEDMYAVSYWLQRQDDRWESDMAYTCPLDELINHLMRMLSAGYQYQCQWGPE